MEFLEREDFGKRGENENLETDQYLIFSSPGAVVRRATTLD